MLVVAVVKVWLVLIVKCMVSNETLCFCTQCCLQHIFCMIYVLSIWGMQPISRYFFLVGFWTWLVDLPSTGFYKCSVDFWWIQLQSVSVSLLSMQHWLVVNHSKPYIHGVFPLGLVDQVQGKWFDTPSWQGGVFISVLGLLQYALCDFNIHLCQTNTLMLVRGCCDMLNSEFMHLSSKVFQCITWAVVTDDTSQ